MQHLLPRMPKGSILAFDEINNPWWPGETEALLEELDLNKHQINRFPFDRIYLTLFCNSGAFMLNILTEASGGLTSGYIIKAIQNAGYRAIGSDIDDMNAGRYMADRFIRMPRVSDPLLWEKMYSLLTEHEVGVVIPSLDETLLGWSERQYELKQKGIHVILSGPETISIFQDKWLTYQFFKKHGIPTPESSLEQNYPLVKPRNGRGSKGIAITEKPIDMTGMISQELLEGEEYTIDVFCNRDSDPVYIVPRKRINVRDGKSTVGITVRHQEMEMWVRKICSATRFLGAINIQCFLCPDDTLQFIEINPRLAGGMALGFASTENWISLMISNIVSGKPIEPKPIQYGMKMLRYYDEIFVP